VSGRRYGFLRRWQIALRESGLSKAAKAVGAFLSFRMNQDGTIEGNQFPAIERVAKDAGYSRSAAVYALRELRRAGLVDVESGKGRHVVNRYTLTIPDHLEVRIEYVLSGGKTVPAEVENGQSTTRKRSKDDVENGQPLPTSNAVSIARAATAAAACVRCGSLLAGRDKTWTHDGAVCLRCDGSERQKRTGENQPAWQPRRDRERS
jgi:DNA-binding transcriptional ArsR family regulator